jgi:peptidyl-prolyl cis-trans isomerase A (cyclophilin A)
VTGDGVPGLLALRVSDNLKLVRFKAIPLVLLLCLASAANAQAAPADLPDAPGATAKTEPVPTGPTVVIDTSMGRLTCKTFDKQAPNAVANFIGLADGTKEWSIDGGKTKQHGRRFYDGLTFHRVIPGFMIQGGDPVGDGTGDPGYYFQDETDPSLTFSVPGRLAMANSGPNTNGSQFFVTVAPTPWLTGKHTIFGEVTDGMEVVNAISTTPTGAGDRPATEVVLEKVSIEES